MKRPMILQRLLLASLVAVLSSGCIQIERTIRLERDGSGTLTEVIRFEDHLVAMARGSKDLQALTDSLRRERINERLPLFGEVALVSYETRERGGVVNEAKAVFSFRDINSLRIPAFPGRASNWPSEVVRFNLRKPVVFRGGYYGFATFFQMPLDIRLDPPPQAVKPAEARESPLDQERLRSRLPAVRAMLHGFHWSLSVEAFGAAGAGGNSGTSKTHVVYDVRDSDLDDDETLLRVLEWNQRPDEHFAWNERIGLADGRILNGTRTVVISLNSPPAQQQPVNPLRDAGGGTP